MNVYVSVDMEGITGIVHGDMMSAEGREYDRGRRLMTGDANAAIEGLVTGRRELHPGRRRPRPDAQHASSRTCTPPRT